MSEIEEVESKRAALGKEVASLWALAEEADRTIKHLTRAIDSQQKRIEEMENDMIQRNNFRVEWSKHIEKRIALLEAKIERLFQCKEDRE